MNVKSLLIQEAPLSFWKSEERGCPRNEWHKGCQHWCVLRKSLKKYGLEWRATGDWPSVCVYVRMCVRTVIFSEGGKLSLSALEVPHLSWSESLMVICFTHQKCRKPHETRAERELNVSRGWRSCFKKQGIRQLKVCRKRRSTCGREGYGQCWRLIWEASGSNRLCSEPVLF